MTTSYAFLTYFVSFFLIFGFPLCIRFVPLKRKYCTFIKLKTVGLFILYYLLLTSSSSYCCVYVTVQTECALYGVKSRCYVSYFWPSISNIFSYTPSSSYSKSVNGQIYVKFTTGSPDFHYTAYSTALTTQKLPLNMAWS